MKFSDIPGHATLKETLVNSYKKNHIAHAQLFAGQEGSAALALALAYIAFLLCEDKSDHDSCGSCPACQKVHKLIHPDVHCFLPGPGKGGENQEKTNKTIQNQQALWREMLVNGHPYISLEDWSLVVDAENKKTQISKEDARNIIRTVSLKSFEGSYKIILIWYPELMHPSAANAILKVLEEPPSDTLYLLVSYHHESLLTTILSRTQLVQVPLFSDEEIARYLTEKMGIPQAQAASLAGLSSGNLRKAIHDIDEAENIDHQLFAQWMRACLADKYDLLIRMAADFKSRGKSQQKMFLRYGITLLRQALMAKTEISLMNITGEAQQFAIRFANATPVEVLEKIALELGQMIEHLDRNANAQLTFMATGIRLSRLMRMPVKKT